MADEVVRRLDPLGSPEEIPCVLRLLSEREAAGAMCVFRPIVITDSGRT